MARSYYQKGLGIVTYDEGVYPLANHAYLVTSATIGRQCFFDDFHAGCAAARCFEESALLGDARMLAWVLMPDYTHWLVQLGKKDPLSLVVNRIKSASARFANRVLARKGAFWEPGYHDHGLRREEDLRGVARYNMIANPLRAGLVQRVGDYPFGMRSGFDGSRAWPAPTVGARNWIVTIFFKERMWCHE